MKLMFEHPDFPGSTSLWVFVAVGLLVWYGFSLERKQQKKDHEASVKKKQTPRP